MADRIGLCEPHADAISVQMRQIEISLDSLKAESSRLASEADYRKMRVHFELIQTSARRALEKLAR